MNLKLFFIFSSLGYTIALGEDKVYTMDEIGFHNHKKSCWQIIDDKVYDFTSYLKKHPAPMRIMLQFCGKDSTKAFADKTMGAPHSTKAQKMLGDYYIGILEKKEIK